MLLRPGLQDLIPLARSSGDPCAQAALVWAAGNPQAAMQTLISGAHQQHGQHQGQQLQGGGAPVGADPFLLDFVLGCGIYQLSGR
jgi:hypothetical protein